MGTVSAYVAAPLEARADAVPAHHGHYRHHGYHGYEERDVAASLDARADATPDHRGHHRHHGYHGYEERDVAASLEARADATPDHRGHHRHHGYHGYEERDVAVPEVRFNYCVGNLSPNTRPRLTSIIPTVIPTAALVTSDVMMLEGLVYQCLGCRRGSVDESCEKRCDPQYLGRIQLLSFFPRVLFPVI